MVKREKRDVKLIKTKHGIKENVSKTVDQAMFIMFLKEYNALTAFVCNLALFRNLSLSEFIGICICSRSIASAFVWDKSTEGSFYWAKLSVKWSRFYSNMYNKECEDCGTNYSLLMYCECPICNQNK